MSDLSYSEKRKAGTELMSAFESFKEVHAELKSEVEDFGASTVETKNKLERINDRLDLFETKLSRPPIATGNKLEETPHAKAFKKFITKGDELEIKQISMNETIDPQGGYLVPPEWSSFIIESLVQWSPLRRYATTMRVSSKEFKIPVQQRAQNLQTGADAAGLFKTGWTADMGPVAQTDTGLVGLATIPTNDMYCLPYVTQDMLDDAAYNVESFLQDNVAKSFAHLEGAAFVNGNGVGQPLGIMNNTDAYSQARVEGAVPNSLGDDTDILMEAYYKLPDYYARNGTWFLNRQTIRAIRSWTDGNGQFVWTPVYGEASSLEAPALILGRPYAECIDMVAPTAYAGANLDQPVYTPDAVPIIFGDMRSAYVITDRMGIRMLRDPYSQKPFVLFYTTARVGGQVVLPEALCAIKVNA